MERLRSRLTYPHVVSTLALFVALGGSAYAVGLGKNEVRSRNIAPQAVKTSDLANDAATGAKVKESSLSAVPNALTADRASNAQTADRALNADLLNGIDAGAFERSTRIQFGQAFNNVTTEEVVISWPELGLQVLNDGDTTILDEEIRIRNTRPPGGELIVFSSLGSNSGTTLAPQATSAPIETASASGPALMVSDGGSAIRGMLLECGLGAPDLSADRVFCFGIRSEP